MNQRRTLTTVARGAKSVARSPAAPPADEAKGATAGKATAARHELIAVQAYYLAEERCFVPGAELDDWLAAEARVDARLRETQTEHPRERSG